MLVGRVVDDELGDDPDIPAMRFVNESFEVLQRAVRRVDVLVIGNVVPVVAKRRGIEREQPEAIDPEALEVVELLRQPGEVSDAVAVAVEKRAYVRLIDNRVFVPELVRHDPATEAVVSRAGREGYARCDPVDRAARNSILRARSSARPTED